MAKKKKVVLHLTDKQVNMMAAILWDSREISFFESGGDLARITQTGIEIMDKVWTEFEDAVGNADFPVGILEGAPKGSFEDWE